MSVKKILLGGSLVLGGLLSFFSVLVFLSSGMTPHLVSLGNLGGFLFLSFRQAAFFIPLYLFAGALFLHLSVVNMRAVMLWNLSCIPFFTLSWLLRVMMSSYPMAIPLLAPLGRENSTLILLGLFLLEMGGLFFLSRRISTAALDEGSSTAVLLLPAASSLSPVNEEWQDFRTDTHDFIRQAEGTYTGEASFSSPPGDASFRSDPLITVYEDVDSTTSEENFPHSDSAVFEEREEPAVVAAMPPSSERGIALPEISSETTVVSSPEPISSVEMAPTVRREGDRGSYHIPEDILSHTEKDVDSSIDSENTKQGEVLEATLREFDIEARVIGVRKGSTVTRFEVLPAPGIKLVRISNLADNFALRLAAESIRIVAPIPGKEAVGIEIPNKKRSLVHFGDVILKKEFRSPRMHIPIVLGEDITGNARIFDLTRMPHLLIAGATGSGKSVCVNIIICSILYRCSPDEVKFILIDPKIVELSFYNGIPHLLTQVVNKASQAFQVLQYCICEMEHRYSQLEFQGVRDIHSYNVKMIQQGREKIPYIVVIIDEFADLMIGSGKDLESTVSRLAAMSRAVGIHLVLATQRPSADVITGLIKANIPTRIAFMVASKVDSRIIIDSMGAEKLLGRGDLLFTSPSSSFPIRMQGAYLSETEVENIVQAAKDYGSPAYLDEEIFIEDEDSSFSGTEESDPLIKEAAEIVRRHRKTSVSFLQRKLRIGYNRAARLMEELEQIGVVGALEGNKARQILPHS